MCLDVAMLLVLRWIGASLATCASLGSSGSLIVGATALSGSRVTRAGSCLKVSRALDSRRTGLVVPSGGSRSTVKTAVASPAGWIEIAAEGAMPGLVAARRSVELGSASQQC